MIRKFLAFGGCLLWLSWGSASPQVLFLDVGQGDAAVVVGRSAQGMIDAGPAWGEASLAQEIFLQLTGMGVTSLDFIGLSHGDRDHWGGIPGLLERIPVGALLLHPGAGPKIPRVLNQALVSETRFLSIRGPQVSPGPEETWWAWPVFGDRSNDQGLVFLWERRGCRFLFLGDLEKEGEQVFLKQFSEKVDVLKVSHHGSGTSSHPALIQQLKPRWGVISAGSRNPYRHPHAKVLDRFRAAGTDILRTDFHGFVRFTQPQSGTLRCETAEGSCGEHRCYGRNRRLGEGI